MLPACMMAGDALMRIAGDQSASLVYIPISLYYIYRYLTIGESNGKTKTCFLLHQGKHGSAKYEGSGS
jgi:hypothetical protein